VRTENGFIKPWWAKHRTSLEGRAPGTGSTGDRAQMDLASRGRV